MKYYLLFVFFFLLNTKNVWAEIGTISLDTSIDQSNHKHSKQYFLENYDKDDSTKALINYFFKKRKTAFYQTVIPVVAGGLTILLVKALNRNNYPVSGKSSGYGGLVLGGALVYVILHSSAQLIGGQITWLVFSRHKLLKILVDYKSGKPLPKKITRKKAFKYEWESLKKLK
jgi:hypothetical protein